MSDDKAKRGVPDRDTISLSERYEVEYWTKALGVSESKLREAVARVGKSAAAVRKYLGK